MREIMVEPGFDDFRERARELLERRVSPACVRFVLEGAAPSLFGSLQETFDGERRNHVNVPRRFLELAAHVAHHGDPSRYDALYRLVYRLVWEERALLEMETDTDVHRCLQMQRDVKREVEKTRAFVRFTRTEGESGPLFIAYHPTRHPSLPLSAPFFARRFSDMQWAIITPQCSVSFDGELHFGPGGPMSDAPPVDELEGVFREYYRAIFNPARVKLKTMKQHMPQRYWAGLTETHSLTKLVQEAPGRVREMNEAAARLARVDELTPLANDGPQPLNVIREGLSRCQACALHNPATQVVAGEGPESAQLFVVGEQPGDEEDLAGRPFVGPSGQLLDQLLVSAGLRREELYLTNAVKHFSFVQRGKRRMHQQPRASEAAACRPWLIRELERVQPTGIVCLGVTAARAVLGQLVKLKDVRGRPLPVAWARFAIVSWHPAAILRSVDEQERRRRHHELALDLAHAKDLLKRVTRDEASEAFPRAG